jgi:hypothetical protein
MRDPEDLVSICYDEMATGVYATTTALYVSQDNFMNGSAAMRIGSGQVSVRLWTGGQRDFRMNEYQGMMRVMTAEPTSDGRDWQDHRPSALLLDIGTVDLRNLGIELLEDSVFEPSASEAMTDLHAFTYLPGDTTDRLAIPATVTTGSGAGGRPF